MRLPHLAMIVLIGACSSPKRDFSFPGSAPTPPVVHGAAPLGSSRLAYATYHPSAPAEALAVATDPDHDSIWLVPDGGEPLQIELGVGDIPADIAVTSRTTDTQELETVIYVSLHGGGALVSIPTSTLPTSGVVPYTRIPVCAQPRGLDTNLEAGDNHVYIACADGSLLTLDPQSDSVVSTLTLGVDDLKDVVVMPGNFAFVTQFRTANVLQVDLGSGTFTQSALPGVPGFQAEVAWQMVPIGGIQRTGAFIVHQLASTAQIDVVVPGGTPEGTDAGPIGIPIPPDSDGGPTGSDNSQCSQSGYGPPPDGCTGLGGCGPGGVVMAAATIVVPTVISSSGLQGVRPPSAGTQPAQPLPPSLIAAAILPGLVGPLTVADLSAPANEEAFVIGLGTGGIAMAVDVTEALNNVSDGSPSCAFEAAVTIAPNAVAIAFDPQAPSIESVMHFDKQTGSLSAFISAPRLGNRALPFQKISGEGGRDLFHAATPSMTSCASCHPNGRDDGHIWNFNPMGLRRTPELGGGLLATAPFHWDGAETDISHLMTDVFVGRMEAQPPTPDEVTAISEWLNGLPVSHDHVTPDAAAAARGQILFQSAAVGCATCHSGEHFTNNQTVNVGTGGAFQVPSLLGVGSRAPYLHDGRAATLADRFNPTLGGGDLHGKTSQLTADQVSDLVAYLQSL